MQETKTCRHCEQSLPFYKFHVKRGAEFDRHPYCKDCRREMGGHTKREPKLRSQEETITYETLVEDVLELERKHPRDFKIREAVQRLRDDPNWQPTEYVADLLYEQWEARMRCQMDFSRLDEEVPVCNRRTEENYAKRTLSLDMCIEYEIV